MRLVKTRCCSIVLLVMVACGSPEGPPVGSLGEAATINGRIESWPKGDRLPVRVWIYYPDFGTDLAMGSVDQDGSFTITLPGGDSVAPHLQQRIHADFDACPSKPTFTPAGLRNLRPVLWVDGPARSQQLILASAPVINPRFPGNVAARLVYSEQDGRIAGRLHCTILQETDWDYDVRLARGWNWEVSTVIDRIGEWGSRETVRSGPPPADLRWYMLPPD